jgi:protein tyrosine phosphatase
VLGPCPVEKDYNAISLNLGVARDIPACCLDLCRYKNILPNRQTLVMLKPLPDLEGDARTQSVFINANYITGYDGQVKYIATQGPKPDTIDAFWRMVWENKVDLITMVTG